MNTRAFLLRSIVVISFALLHLPLAGQTTAAQKANTQTSTRYFAQAVNAQKPDRMGDFLRQITSGTR
jgi:hypothetical protein